MNSSSRSFFQRRLVVPVWLEMGGPITGGTLLEIGCGRGAGLRIAHERFGVERAIGLDLDPKMIEVARGEGTDPLVLGDVCAIPARNGSVDAVFDFGAIHIVPDWDAALGEVHRVLRPGGRYYFEWVTFVPYRVTYRLGMDRCAGMRAPRSREVLRSLEEIGFSLLGAVRRRAIAAAQVSGDLVGVATKGSG